MNEPSAIGVRLRAALGVHDVLASVRTPSVIWRSRVCVRWPVAASRCDWSGPHTQLARYFDSRGNNVIHLPYGYALSRVTGGPGAERTGTARQTSGIGWG